MPVTLTRWMRAILLTTLGTASATPALPAPSVATQAVREALTPKLPAPAPARSAPVVRAPQAAPQVVRPAQTPTPRSAPAARPAQAPVARRAPAQPARPAQTPATRAPQAQASTSRAQNIQQLQSQVSRNTARTGRSAILRATAYNSMPGQTDSTPFITATGTRTRPGVVALSRDMLRMFPYGTRITIQDLSGRSGGLFNGRVFIVEDTMAAYKTGSIDIWMSSYGDAIRFGARQVRITALR
ncbi:3D domain-containing protein [Deinococcus aerius]|uniref:3D domain-containing protein n=1 Tax=Deinococcus aerius TaxID=200253 RepID=A0A2I9DP94_9DEIO|nr:hypothetical protein [Deinococcus aerius]GBF03917.1 3D domain-containing protein [Deinococcus aerius]